jgi:hypothetical protein
MNCKKGGKCSFFSNCKGQGLSTTTLILIVLGVFVLILLIAGFTIGWKRFGEFLTPSNNVDDVVRDCGIACTSGSKYNFCSLKRELRSTDLPEAGQTAKEESCSFFATNESYVKYGIKECPNLCPTPVEETK